MSIRTLIEINHDKAHELDPTFLTALCGYVATTDSLWAEALETFGVRVISCRHHADNFRIPVGTPGFPLSKAKGSAGHE